MNCLSILIVSISKFVKNCTSNWSFQKSQGDKIDLSKIKGGVKVLNSRKDYHYVRGRISGHN